MIKKGRLPADVPVPGPVRKPAVDLNPALHTYNDHLSDNGTPHKTQSFRSW